MATYKVIQDVEAEDKLVGPLSLRQFLYAGAAILCGYFCFLAIFKHVYPLIIFFPPMCLAAFFAFPWGREQPTEVWALAKVRFALKPRRRIWDQTGAKQLVTVTAPRHVAVAYTNGLSQTEVKSRLSALADTIDSRGWAIKNVNINMVNGAPTLDDQSDRLVGASSLPVMVDDTNINAADDMMDEQNNPVAQAFTQMIDASSQAHRAKLMAQMQQPSTDDNNATTATKPDPANPPANYWFLNDNSSASATNQPAQVVVPGTTEAEDTVDVAGQPTPEEEALADKLRIENNKPTAAYSHLPVIQPLSAQHKSRPTLSAKPAGQTSNNQMTARPDPAIIALANNNDLNVATLARQAKKQEAPDEVIVPLH